MTSAQDNALAIMATANIRTFHPGARVEWLGREDWASVTFSGARHRLRSTFDGPGAVGAAADLLEKMSDLDWPMRGAFVADVELRAEGRSDDGRHAWLEIELLVIDED